MISTGHNDDSCIQGLKVRVAASAPITGDDSSTEAKSLRQAETASLPYHNGSAASAASNISTNLSPNSMTNNSATLDIINRAIEKGTYHDYSRVTTQQLSSEIAYNKKRKPNFPRKLHEILSNPDEHGDVIAWLPHGRAWEILNNKRLESDLLPNFFSHNSRASFLRQVNNWGFKRVARGRDENAYYHEVRF